MPKISELRIPSAFTAEELANNSDWIVELTAAETAEVETALQQHLGPDVRYQDITKSEFSLPCLSTKLAHIIDTTEDGTGAAILRGLPVEKYEPSEIKKMFWGIGLHLGTAIEQSKSGELINDLQDTGLKIGDPKSRWINASGPSPLHTDPCDLLVMLSVEEAARGGETELASCVAAHNEMLRRHPDLLEILYEPLYHKLPDWYEGAEEYYPLPTFSSYQGYFSCTHRRYLVEDAQKHTDAPRLSEKQIQALDKLDEVYNDPKFKLTTRLMPGDLLVMNNLLLVHGRTAFTDDATSRRHLMRLWISHPKTRPLPPEYSLPFRNNEAGSVRGGSLIVKW